MSKADPGECWKCGRAYRWRVRKLCATCWVKGVGGKFNGRWMSEKPLPASAPTGAPAGSDEKVEVMRQRFERGEEVFHPDDSGMTPPEDRMT
jgi:hypothetical protein